VEQLVSTLASFLQHTSQGTELGEFEFAQVRSEGIDVGAVIESRVGSIDTGAAFRVGCLGCHMEGGHVYSLDSIQLQLG